MCGKNERKCRWRPGGRGSPPRVREERVRMPGDKSRSGITPACAGRTVVIQPQYLPFWDHPRVCGKNFLLYLSEQAVAGSPPRVREEHAVAPFTRTSYRITPACAGRTVKKSPFYAFSFSSLFMNPFTFVTSSLKISTFVLLCCSVLSPIP